MKLADHRRSRDRLGLYDINTATTPKSTSSECPLPRLLRTWTETHGIDGLEPLERAD